MARAVRAEEAVDLTGLDAKIDPVDGPDVLELAHQALDLDPVPSLLVRTPAFMPHIGESIGAGPQTGRAALHLRAQL